ncbi:MAG: hypothetical protein JWN42_2292 [Candidatus Angelobacter sp.]|nr:hypothetical protein [Candidatus Angelobacter sp.]
MQQLSSQVASYSLLSTATQFADQRLEPEDDSTRIAQTILVIAGTGGESGGQCVSGIEAGANVVELRGADSEVPAQPDIDTAAEGHSKSACAIDGCGDPAKNGNRHAGGQSGMRLAEQSVSEDRALAEVCGGSGTKQEVIQMLLRAGGKAQKGNAVKLSGVAADVGGDAEMRNHVESALYLPPVEIRIVVMQQGISAIDGSAGRNIITALGHGHER